MTEKELCRKGRVLFFCWEYIGCRDMEKSGQNHRRRRESRKQIWMAAHGKMTLKTAASARNNQKECQKIVENVL